MKKFGLQLADRRKWCSLIFAFFLYPNFKNLLSKILEWILRVFSNFYYVTNIFELDICDNETAALFFLISTDMHFFFKNKETLQPPF